MGEKVKTAFITGTTLLKEVQLMEKKLRFLGYNTIASLVGNPDENRKQRLEAMLTCDEVFVYENFTGKDRDIYKMEQDVAYYLGMKTYKEEDLNRMVAEAAVADPPQNPVAPLKVGDNSKNGSMAEPE